MGVLRLMNIMQKSKTSNGHSRTIRDRANHRSSVGFRRVGSAKTFLPFALAGLIVLSACGGSNVSQSQSTGALAGNWQFTMTAPSDNSFQGGMQGGFLLQSKGSVTGGITYSVSLPSEQQGGSSTLCSSGRTDLYVIGDIECRWHDHGRHVCIDRWQWMRNGSNWAAVDCIIGAIADGRDSRQLSQLSESRPAESGFSGDWNPHPG